MHIMFAGIHDLKTEAAIKMLESILYSQEHPEQQFDMNFSIKESTNSTSVLTPEHAISIMYECLDLNDVLSITFST